MLARRIKAAPTVLSRHPGLDTRVTLSLWAVSTALVVTLLMSTVGAPLWKKDEAGFVVDYLSALRGKDVNEALHTADVEKPDEVDTSFLAAEALSSDREIEHTKVRGYGAWDSYSEMRYQSNRLMLPVMTTTPMFTRPSALRFCAPLSEERADRLANMIARHSPSTIMDIGCGWGELLSRMVAASPDATGIGVDNHAPDVDRANDNAARCGLAERVEFHLGDASTYHRGADAVLNIGASHVFGPTPQALRQLYRLVNPGGVLLFADGFWQRPPTTTELSHMWNDASQEDHPDLAGLVTMAQDAGFIPLWVESANRDEWETFESGFLADKAEWLVHNGHSPQADTIRAEVDRMRHRFLRGYRDVLGFGYLLLAKPA